MPSMLHLGLRKPRANELGMQIIENTLDPLFHDSFPPPCRGHCLHAGTPSFRYAYLRRYGCGKAAAPPHPRREDPQGDSDFLQATRNPAVCPERPGRLKPGSLALPCDCAMGEGISISKEHAAFKSLGCSGGCQCDLMRSVGVIGASYVQAAHFVLQRRTFQTKSLCRAARAGKFS